VEGEDRGDALMRILHIGKYFPPVAGGMERFLGDLVKAQREAGHEVSVLVHDTGHGDARDDPPWLMRCPVWIRLFFAPISPRFPFWLARAMRRYRPDVLHLHMPNLGPFWALLLPSARRIPWVVHWQSDIEFSKRSLRLAYPHYMIFERALLERAEAIIATSQSYLAASRPLGPWRHKCHVVPLGVDPERLPEVRREEGDGLWTGQGLRLLAVGRLTYYKGFETLLSAVAGMVDVQLVVVGEGEERPALQAILEKARSHGTVRLLGAADDATLCRLLASCDLFCFPSRERTEAFGIVLMEAMRYGRPLLASRLAGSGVNWVARDGQNAMTVPIGDVPAWRAAIEALAASPEKRRLLGHLGYQRYLREFDIHKVARRIEGVYATALTARGADTLQLARPAFVRRAAIGGAPGGDASWSRRGTGRRLVVIPALNEADDIGDVIRQARAHGGIDVLVVDDGSTDATAAIALACGAAVAKAPLWQGAWGAIQTGIRYAVRHGYAAVVTMDADGQHEPAYLPLLIEAAERGANVVIASCPSRGSRLRHVAWSYFRFLTGFELDDLTSGFRYYDMDACALLARQEATLLDYQDVGVLLLLRHARFRIAEISVAMNPRRHGASRVFSSWWTVARYMAETSLLCFARWKAPARRERQAVGR
jgi:glycosyltransferase involved in cell wall biosynthesis